jgi:3-deoxy-7-phosphoheptulonate synthase
MENLLGTHPGELNWLDFFTSHEGLHLRYEQAQTRHVPRHTGWYNLSTHFPWIGVRTADPQDAHIEYFRGIANPIGLKVGTGTTPEALAQLIGILDPAGEPGRLTLIHRFGREHIGHCLPPLIAAARATGKTLLWCCDPMHGNTRTTSGGVKTRYFEDILGELDQAFDIHVAEGSRLGGIHIELTGEAVTECVGGARGLSEADLKHAYRSQLDPRLNYEQALELALFTARKMSAWRGSR